MATQPCAKFSQFSEEYDIAYDVATGRGLPPEKIKTLYPKTHEGEILFANELDAYEKMANPNGNVHGFSDGVDPYRHGRPNGPMNQGRGTDIGRNPFTMQPDIPVQSSKQRDDIEFQRRYGM